MVPSHWIFGGAVEQPTFVQQVRRVESCKGSHQKESFGINWNMKSYTSKSSSGRKDAQRWGFNPLEQPLSVSELHNIPCLSTETQTNAGAVVAVPKLRWKLPPQEFGVGVYNVSTYYRYTAITLSFVLGCL